MKPMHVLMLAGIVLMSPAVSVAQVAGTTTVGVTVTELQEVAKGWSVKRTILGQPVYNDKDEQVGSIDDIIVSPDKAVSYAIVNAGGFTIATAKPLLNLKYWRGTPRCPKQCATSLKGT